jgi:hypothetical protein
LGEGGREVRWVQGRGLIRGYEGLDNVLMPENLNLVTIIVTWK